MDILGSLIVLRIGLGISILVLVVVRSLEVECSLVLVLILVLWWWSDLMVGILRMRWYLGMVVFRRWWSQVGGDGILRILGIQIDDGGILSRSRQQNLS